MRAKHSIPFLLILACGVSLSAADELPKPPDNAALQYWQAFQFLPGDAQTLRAAKPSSDGLSWTKQAVSSGSYAILFLRRGAATKSVDWGLAYDQGMFCPAPHVAATKHLAQLGLLYARQAVLEKQFDDAADMSADLLVLARHTAAAPLSWVLLGASEIQSDVVRQLAGQLSVMPRETLTKLSQRLRALPEMPTLEQTLRGERELIAVSQRIAAAQAQDPQEVERIKADFADLNTIYDELTRLRQLLPDQWAPAEAELQARVRGMKSSVTQRLALGRAFKDHHAIARSRVELRLLEAAVMVVRDGPDAAGKFTDPYLNKPIKHQPIEGGFELISEVPIEGKPVSLRVVASKAPAPAAGAEDDIATIAAKLFRTNATTRAVFLRMQLSAADALDERSRDQLTRMLDDYERKVAEQTEKVRKEPDSLHEISERGGKMQLEWENDVLDKWMSANPDAQAVMEDVAAMLEAVIDTILNDREQIVAAAVRAGLPQIKKQEARKIVDIAYGGFRAYAEIFQHRQQQEARLPEGDPKRFLSSTALVEWEMKKLEIATDTRTRLRELMPLDRRANLDEELTKLGER